MTTDEFAGKIKAKYPSYGSMDNNELTQKIVAKHPEYKTQISDFGVKATQKTFGNKAYDFAQETVPYIAGGLAGATGMPAGPEVGIPAAGLAYAGAKSGLRGIGKMAGYEKQNTLGQEAQRTALQDLPTGMAMEELGPATKQVMNTPIAKRAGQGMADMFGTLPGVESKYVKNLFKNPTSILPSWLGGPQALKDSGAEMGAIENRLGIPSLEQEPIEPLYKIRPPKKVRIANPEREGINPDTLMKNIDPSRRGMLDKALKEMKGPTESETNQEVAYRVHKMMAKSEVPTTAEAVQALKGTNEALDKLPADMTTGQKKVQLRLTKQAKRLQSLISQGAPDLQKARGSYAAGKTREAFTEPAFGLISKDKTGGISKMGAARTFGPFALTRMGVNPAFAGLLMAGQSPIVLGGATAGAGTIAKLLESKLAPYAANSLRETLKRQRGEE